MPAALKTYHTNLTEYLHFNVWARGDLDFAPLDFRKLAQHLPHDVNIGDYYVNIIAPHRAVVSGDWQDNLTGRWYLFEFTVIRDAHGNVSCSNIRGAGSKVAGERLTQLMEEVIEVAKA